MSSTSCEQTRLRLCRELSKRRLSVSHDKWHLERVLGFAGQLQAIYGGDLEVITAAALLHDLGRSEAELRGGASVAKSVDEARKILTEVDLPVPKIEQVLVAIDEHDQPKMRPSTIEGLILKDADFLAGFGAWGVLRIAMWAGETNRGVRQVLDRLANRMPRRLDSLEFRDSVLWAKREVSFANLFLARLGDPARLREGPPRGTYIVLEGISGSGKDTQADMLNSRLEELGHRVVRVSEPAGKYQRARDRWGPRGSDPVIQTFLLLADRYELMCEKVKPALDIGDVVLSVRSFLSTLVHQRQGVYDSASIAFMHRFVPPADLVVLYDLDVDVAYNRCSTRAQADEADVGIYETRETLLKHRQLYLEAIKAMSALETEVVDASQSISEVFGRTWAVVERVLPKVSG